MQCGFFDANDGQLSARRCPTGLSVLTAVFVFFFFTSVDAARVQGQENEKKILVCSTTQVADFARQIVGDRWEVICVLGPAEDPHTYEVGADDGIAVSRADLCAENGWHLEGHDWMHRLATEAGKPIVTCIEGVEPLNMEQGGREVRDPHAWFDPKNAMIYVRNLADAVSRLDPENESEYRARAELYTRQLGLLNAWVKKMVVEIPANRRILVSHHDAFGYFCKAFHFDAFSPVGWSTAELTEVTPAQRQLVVDKIRGAGIPAIFVETSTNDQLIKSIARDAGVKIGGTLYSDGMGPAGSAGEGYIGMLRENVLTILQALKQE